MYLYSSFAISSHPILPNVAADISSCDAKEQELGDMMALKGKEVARIHHTHECLLQ